MTQTHDKKVPKLRFPGFEGAWKKRHLSDFCDIMSGYPVQGDDILETSTEVPLMRGINITEGRIRHSPDIDRYFGGTTDGLERFLIKAGDVVLGMDGSKVGRNVAVIGKADAGAFLIQRVARMRSVGPNVLDFAYHFVFSPLFHRYVDRINTSSGIPHISLKQIKDFEIVSPLPDEQRKIAGFLGVVDEKIAQLTKKKALLEDYKKGCMQQLFSQKIRFKDDAGEDFPDWRQTTLGRVVTFAKGKGISKADISENGSIPCIRYGEIYTHYREHITEVLSSTDIPRSELFLSMAGDVIVPASGEDPLDMARACCVESAGIALGGDINILRGAPNGVFLAYYLNNAKRKEIAGFAQGNSVVHLYGSQLHQLSIAQPHPDEQRKIAAFLSAIDIKIDLVSQELELAQTFKKGLLQQMFV